MSGWTITKRVTKWYFVGYTAVKEQKENEQTLPKIKFI